jgi:hypothetical protein
MIQLFGKEELGNHWDNWGASVRLIRDGLTGKLGKCSVVLIINRDSHMISKKASLCTPFPFIRTHATSVRIARCFVQRQFI